MPERGSKTSTVPVVWANLEFFRLDPNYFLSRLVSMDETWLYRYDPETKQLSMEWRHSGSPRYKKFQVQKSAGKFSPRFFGIKTVPSALIIFQRTQLSTRSITHLFWCNWRIFWRKNAAGRSPRGPCSCTTMHWALANPEESGLPGLPMSWSPTLFSVSGPVGLLPIPWTEKTTERSPFFVRRRGHCCRGNLVGRTTFWFSFWVGCKR